MIKDRTAKVKAAMVARGVDAILVCDNTSLLYLSGAIFGGVAYISLEMSEPLLCVRRPVGMEGANVAYIRKVEDLPNVLRERGLKQPERLALEGDVATYNEYLRLAKIFSLPSEQIVPVATAIMHTARSCKGEDEIEQLKASAALHSQLYSLVPQIFKRGMSDQDLAIEINHEALKLGAVGKMRIFGRTMDSALGSILVGENASTPSPFDFALGGGGVSGSMPYGANGTEITDGTTIMVDHGGNFSHYITDMTRVFSLGKLPDIAYRAHSAALEMQQRMVEMARVGSAVAEIYNMSIEVAQREGLSEWFMGSAQQASFVGHGVGLEINEQPVLSPRSKSLFEVGNTIAFEPKFTLPKVGAVGIENTFVMRENGLEQLTIFEESIIPLEG
ncbi:MAG: Xaa-Pro peptidase family protein [Rikenellaceae bacterium]